MPIFLYQISPVIAGFIIFVFIETLALIGLWVARHLLTPRLKYHEGVHEAVSGTVQAIGVFYGITVGLIAAGVWNTNSNASELVSKEAASIGSLYRDVSGYPHPIREEMQTNLRDYTFFIINEAWPAQKSGRGQTLEHGVRIMDDFTAKLYAFKPSHAGEVALHAETLRAFNTLHRLPPVTYRCSWQRTLAGNVGSDLGGCGYQYWSRVLLQDSGLEAARSTDRSHGRLSGHGYIHDSHQRQAILRLRLDLAGRLQTNPRTTH